MGLILNKQLESFLPDAAHQSLAGSSEELYYTPQLENEKKTHKFDKENTSYGVRPKI